MTWKMRLCQAFFIIALSWNTFCFCGVGVRADLKDYSEHPETGSSRALEEFRESIRGIRPPGAVSPWLAPIGAPLMAGYTWNPDAVKVRWSSAEQRWERMRLREKWGRTGLTLNKYECQWLVRQNPRSPQAQKAREFLTEEEWEAAFSQGIELEKRLREERKKREEKWEKRQMPWRYWEPNDGRPWSGLPGNGEVRPAGCTPLNPFRYNRDPEPPWIVPQPAPTDSDDVQVANDEKDDDTFIPLKLQEVFAGRMWEQAEQYRRLGTRKGAQASEFLLTELVRQYPQTTYAKMAKEFLSPETWEKAHKRALELQKEYVKRRLEEENEKKRDQLKELRRQRGLVIVKTLSDLCR